MSSILPIFFLVIVAAIWGLTFPMMEVALKMQDPFLFIALRFSFAALPILPYFLRHINKKFFRIGVMLGVLNSGIFLTQTIGLQTVNASRAAFISGCYVFLIPFLAPLFKMGKPGKHEFFGALICFLGVYLLTGSNMKSLMLGDGLIFANAILIAISIICTSLYSKAGFDPYMIAFSPTVMTALFTWCFCPFFSTFHFEGFRDPTYLSALIVCSFFASILATILQAKYQKQVSVTKAALILSLAPVFATIFDTCITGIFPSLSTIMGGLCILAAILYLEIVKPAKRLESE